MNFTQTLEQTSCGYGRTAACFLAIALLSIVSARPAFAQITTTSMTGDVTDKSGAGVGGAEVTALNVDTKLSRSTETNGEGEYTISLLPVGNYELDVSAPGFKKFVRTGIVLELNVPARVDAVMQLGEVTETVNVTAGAPLVNTSSQEIGRTIENQEIVNLPLVNRNAYQLLELTPGVQNSSFNPGQVNPIITLGYPEQRTFINGGVDGGAGSVSYYLDGGINMTGLRNTGNILPNPDAIQEYTVETNNYDAEYGKMSAGVISVVTKSGTNDFHGSLFEFWRNDALNATPWNSTVGKPPLHRNQFGGTFGGPIIKNKTFFFVSYQGLRQLSGFLTTGSVVPTAAEAGGNLSALATVAHPVVVPANVSCGTNIICSQFLDPVAQHLLNATTFPCIPYVGKVGATPACTASSTTGYQAIVPSPYNTDEFLIKIDHQLTNSQRLSGSYFYTSGNNMVPPLNSTSGQPNTTIPWDVQQFNWRQQNANVSDTWTASPNLVNQVWLGYTRNIAGRLNMPATSLGDLGSNFTIEGPHSLPQITVTGFFTLASAIAGPKAGSNFYSARDVATYNHGRHTFSFGAEETLDKDIQQTLLNNYGVFGFNSATVGGIPIPALGDFLLGTPTSITQDAPVTGYTNGWSTGFFGQDNFRMFPRFTLNLGLRWDIQTPPTDPQNRGTTFQPGCPPTCTASVAIPLAPPGTRFFGDPGVTRGIVPVRWHHVSPRVGFAWDPFGDGKTSVRASAGVFYGSVSGNEWNQVTNQEPSAIRFTFTNTSQTFSGVGPAPNGATLSCPYNKLNATFVFGFTNTVTCPPGSSGHGITGNDPFPFAAPNFLVPGGNFLGISPNFQWPYSYQVNFSVQRQVTTNFSVSAAYVGTFSHDLPFGQDINQVATGAASLSCATSAGANIVQRRPIDNPTFATCPKASTATTANASPLGTVFIVQSNQTASYNGLQTTAQLRATRGVTLYAFYTYSKTFSSVELDNNGTQGGAEDFTNLRLERGPADFDLRHQFVASAVWRLDYYKGGSSLARGFANGWSVSTIVNFHSGLPFTVGNGVDANFTGNGQPSATASGQRACLVASGACSPSVPNVIPPFVQGSHEWFNAAAFSQNAPGTGGSIDGNSSRNMLYGPWYKDVDMAVSRDFDLSRFREGLDLQFRIDAYNAFNIVSYNNPNFACSASPCSLKDFANGGTFGEITSANPMRNIQLGAKLSF
ncbi:MAG: carboxypeptidase regulatory-like domain-containing protein [Candidatus Acidiferrales bacterium]